MKEEMIDRLVVFDVCNTLYDSNTTFDFLRFALKKVATKKLLSLKLLSFKFSPFFIGYTILGKLVHKDLVREKAVLLLKGLKRHELLELSEQFYEEHLQERQLQETLHLLDTVKEDHTVWLFSNSLDPIIHIIAQKHGVAYEATQLEYDTNDRATGRIARDMSGKKKDVFLQRFGKEATIKMMCSDNRSDREIMKLATKPYVVVYNAAEKKYWETLKPTFIEKY